MDLDLSPEHELLRQTIRDFMVKEVAPVVDEHERERRFPVDIVRRLGEMGWLGIPIPEDEGGAGLDTLAYAIAIEEIGRVWGSLGLIVAAHTSLGCGPLHLAGTPEQKERFLVPMASGKVLGALRPDRARRRLATPAGRGRRPATRTARTAGPGSSTAASASSPTPARPGRTSITAKTGETEKGDAEISAFIVPADTPGFSVGRLEEKMGLHASATGELIFDGARVPAANMLGPQGDGFRTFLKILDGGQDLDRGARRRTRPGRPRRLDPVRPDPRAVRAADRQLPGRRLHDRRHGDRDRGGPPDGLARGLAQGPGPRLRLAAAQAKLFASEVSSRATNNGIQVHGGYGYVEEYKVERFLRDAKLTEIGEGTSQIQRLVIARKILGLRVV